MAKNGFKLHTLETAPEAAREGLTKVKQAYGRLPNFFAVAAESPAAVNAYLSLSNIFKATALTPVEQQIVILAASVANKCAYCVAAHSKGAKSAGVPDDLIRAVQERKPLPERKLEALRRLVEEIVEKRGWVSEAQVASFLGEGYSRAELLDVLVGVSDEDAQQLHQPPCRAAARITSSPRSDASSPGNQSAARPGFRSAARLCARHRPGSAGRRAGAPVPRP
jgi:AhpD family alkylhydroperoxidase